MFFFIDFAEFPRLCVSLICKLSKSGFETPRLLAPWSALLRPGSGSPRRSFGVCVKKTSASALFALSPCSLPDENVILLCPEVGGRDLEMGPDWPGKVKLEFNFKRNIPYKV